MVFRHPGLEHYQRLIEAARGRLADLELDYGVEKSKVVRMFRADLHGGAHAPSRVDFSALAEIMRRITGTA